ncbi:SCO family protein [Hymenobacter sp. B1770]|uniref:SCO family protein n=1 Tax=Hymenobacter sp. B1770 TaxID=1718788 RepID=UPI003CEE0973
MRPRQTLLLGLLLLLPVLAFLFLFSFGKNRYALPTYLPDRVDSTQVGGKWRRDTVFHQIAPFQLAASTGRQVSSQELGQGLYIAQFYADDEASARVARQLLRVQEKFRKEQRVRLVTFVLSADAANPAALTRLAEQYGTIAGKWFFLTGAPDTLRRLTHQEFRLTADPKRLPGAVYTANIPAGRLLLVDNQRRVRGIYDGTDGREIDRLLTEVTVQLYDYEHPH